VLRAGEDLTQPLSVSYEVTGSAQPGADVNALSGTVTIPAGAHTATIPVQALPDSLAEGAETLTVTLQTGAGYTVGPVNAATIRVLDRPKDDWRHTHFTAAELLDPAISGDAADPDGDTFSNLEEYVLAHHPRTRNEALVELARVNGVLTLTYQRLKVATDTVAVVEGSEDLTTWGTTGIVEEISRVDEGDTERITARLLLQTPANRGFMRVKISPAP
jgi:hypothetical protein